MEFRENTINCLLRYACSLANRYFASLQLTGSLARNSHCHRLATRSFLAHDSQCISLRSGKLIKNFFYVRPDFTKVEHFLNENMENISVISKTFLEQQASCNFF